MAFSTEREQYTIGVIKDALRGALVSLVDKLKELESLESDETAQDRSAVLKLRIGALCKVEKHLLDPLQQEYAFIENSVGELKPGDLFSVIEERQKQLIMSLMQGL